MKGVEEICIKGMVKRINIHNQVKIKPNDEMSMVILSHYINSNHHFHGFGLTKKGPTISPS